MRRDNFTVKVFLWGLHVGNLVWDSNMMCSVFSFSEEYLDSKYDISPNRYPKAKMLRRAFYGNKAFEGLPEFLADSLPDDWGNMLFDKWTSDNRIPLNDVRSLMKLSFIGNRGMGAFEYVPSFDEGDFDPNIDVAALFKVAMGVLHNRESAVFSQERDSLTVKKLILLGTSVGGKHAKGLIAMNGNGIIRSGQIPLPDDFKYYILKFKESEEVPTSEIEFIFHKMALDAGIGMMPSSLLKVAGTNHFITERFDRRPGGEKLFTQTLRALSPSANDYMNLFWLCDSLHVESGQKEQVFRQMVFNFMAGVTDDHSRNFSFIMDKDGNWSVAPAYDVMFTQNTWESPSAAQHCLGMWQKRSHATLTDYVDFGEDIGISNSRLIVKQVANSVCTFNERCRQMGLDGQWTSLLSNVIHELVPTEYLREWTNPMPKESNLLDVESSKLPDDFQKQIDLIGRCEKPVKIGDTYGCVQKFGNELKFQDGDSIKQAIKKNNLLDKSDDEVRGHTPMFTAVSDNVQAVYEAQDDSERILDILSTGGGIWAKGEDGSRAYLVYSIVKQGLVVAKPYEEVKREAALKAVAENKKKLSEGVGQKQAKTVKKGK